MKVNDANLNQTGASQLGKVAQPEAAGSGSIRKGPARDNGESDRVHLSSLSAALLKAVDKGGDQSTSLERIRAEVRAGTYQVDAAAVSRRMIDDAIRG